MKKILSIIVLVIFSMTILSAQNANTKNASSASDPITGFTKIQIPSEYKSDKVFDAKSSQFKKYVFQEKGQKFLIYFDSNKKVAFVGSQGNENNPVIIKTQGWWEKMKDYGICIHYSEFPGECMRIWQ